MSNQVFNFGAGPSMLPVPVMEQIQAEMRDYQGRGMSIIEMNHRSDEFQEIIASAKALFREMMELPDNYRVLWSHGGGGMQFNSVAMNLLGLHPQNKALYCNTGFFSTWAIAEARRFGKVDVITSSEETGFDHIPSLDPTLVDGDAAYLHITTNNTMMGTRWNGFPSPLPMPLIGDATSEILSRPIDVTQFGLLYAGLQKNLGPPGLAAIIIREDLLGHASPHIARQLDYTVLAETDSMPSTPNVFGIYVNRLVLDWTKREGGPKAMEERNTRKAERLYGVIDSSDFYQGHARPEDRSHQNYTFAVPNAELLAMFFAEAEAQGLHGMKSPPMREDVRASMYNAMPMQGAEVLAGFMEDFERRHG
ncbi:MAG: 3-phosphoserine/phosphohydroxythreonine transaminase [SAR324 cluster bacterium]|nr:3-phosphoserine/phosphohydroxythreonine transaminase [SAR324 cluster bacterium]